MFRGSYLAKIDERGRLRLPARFRRDLPETATVYVTSLDGINAKIYPLPAWERIEQKVREAPSMDASVQKLKNYSNYYGLEADMDPQGRILIHPKLREKVQLKLNGDVTVIGNIDHFDICDDDEFRERLEANPVTLDDTKRLTELGF